MIMSKTLPQPTAPGDGVPLINYLLKTSPHSSSFSRCSFNFSFPPPLKFFPNPNPLLLTEHVVDRNHLSLLIHMPGKKNLYGHLFQTSHFSDEERVSETELKSGPGTDLQTDALPICCICEVNVEDIHR